MYHLEGAVAQISAGGAFMPAAGAGGAGGAAVALAVYLVCLVLRWYCRWCCTRRTDPCRMLCRGRAMQGEGFAAGAFMERTWHC